MRCPVTMAKEALSVAAVLALPIAWDWLAKRDILTRPGTRVGFVSHVAVHPVKSLAAVPVASALVTRSGIDGDRELCVVDGHTANFVTQRQRPRMALVTAGIVEESGGKRKVRLSAEGKDPIDVPFPPLDLSETITVTIFGQPVQAVDMGDAAGEWLTSFIGGSSPLRLVIHAGGRAPPPDKYMGGTDITPDLAFPDGFPMLLTTRESLEALNEALAAKDPNSKGVPMRRFRPNMVVNMISAEEADGDLPAGSLGPYGEDTWGVLRIGPGGEAGRGALVRVAKGCGRCVMTTVDPEKGVRSEDGEPLATLRETRMRKGNKAPIFGVNLVTIRGGEIRIGDEVRLVTPQPDGIVPV